MRQRVPTVEAMGVGGFQQQTQLKICKEIGQTKVIVGEDAEIRNS